MSRQDQFKEELFALLRKYSVEMEVEEDSYLRATGIRFWSYTQFDKVGDVIGDRIDLNVGTWCNGVEE